MGGIHQLERREDLLPGVEKTTSMARWMRNQQEEPWRSNF
jgi:hypothetical protein